MDSASWLQSQGGSATETPSGPMTDRLPASQVNPPGTGQNEPLPEVPMSEFGGRYAAEAAEEAKAAEAKAKAEGKAEVKPPEVKPPEEKLEAKPEATPKLYAGEFKTPEELETAHSKLKENYGHSSVEGKRLRTLSDSLQKQLVEMDSKVKLLELDKEAGSFQLKTKEELEAMETTERDVYELKHSMFENKKASILRAKEESERRAWDDQKAQFQLMSDQESAEDYPDFAKHSAKEGLMNQLLNEAPELEGKPYSWIPHLFYLASLGITYREALKEGKGKETKAQEEAKAKAAADAARSGPSGGSGTVTTPTGTKTKEQLDNELQQEILNAGRRPAFG